MLKRSSLLLITSLFIFANITAAQAFHGSQGSSGGLTANTDTHTGSAGFAVPIDVPPGRAGIQPNIQLQYSSSLPNGLLGTGWSLELGSIQRSMHKGVPSYTDTDSDEFVLVQSGSGQKLVFDATAGFYRAKQEGAFMKTEFINNSYWRVTDKKGTRYYFGEDLASREYDPANTARVFKWALNRVEDLNGNTMTITYWRDGNRLYPQYIDYTSNPSNSLASFARVEFLWSARPDTMSGYTAGFLMETKYRLNRVNAWTGTDLQYRFDLTYHASNATGRSLIDTITQYGADGTSSLPLLTFQYQEYVNEPAPAYTITSYNNGASLPQFMGDFNGDGLTDIGRFTPASGKLEVAVSQGTSFGAMGTWYPALVVNAQILVGNFDSDGISDVVAFNPSTGRWTVGLSTGTGFDNKGTWQDSFGAGEKPGTGDFNGDGLTDIMTFYEFAGDLLCRVSINKGGSFEPLTAAQNLHIGNAYNIPYTVDFNGDGLMDFVAFNKSNGYWMIRLNMGNLGFIQLSDLVGFGSNKEIVIADFNMDGLTDIGYYDYSIGKILYKPFQGSTFGDGTWAAFTFTNLISSSTRVQAVDFNGDGLADFAAQNDAGNMEIAYSNGVSPDLLAKSDNGVGGTTTIEYAPSTTFNNPRLPFPLQLVKSVRQSNNLGGVYTTRYEYAGGLWDGQEREFRGFGLVRTTDPDGNYSETVFAQDGIYKGRVTEQRTYAMGRLYGKTLNTWASQQITPGVDFVYLQRKDNFVYDGDATGRRTAEEFFFGETPQMGNLTRAVQLGEVDLSTGSDIGNDTRAVETAYVQNTSGNNWIVGLPRQTTVKDNAGNLVRQAWFYYDNQGNTTAPVKGLLTKKEDWAGTGQVNPVTLYSYDTVGNLSTTTDPKGKVTSVTYDTTYKMFPLTTENAIGHKVTNEYFGVNGVPFTTGDGLNGLWGQLRSTTDPNQKQGRQGYDIFGRVAITISPVDSVQYPTSVHEIAYLGDRTKVTSRQLIKSGQPQTIEVVSFYDGLGRLIQAKTPTEVAGRFVVSGQAEYDTRGLKTRQYLPYFSTNPVDTIEPIDVTRPRSTIEYDAKGRPVRTTNPDGTFASVSYDDWAATATDENGHRQRSYFDAYGRLIKKEEYLGADGRSPNYPAQPYTLYATTLYAYDSEGNLLQTKDAYNNITAITYDALGRKVAMDDPDMGAWTYAYDLNGNLTKQIDAKGQTLTFTYDALNRLTNKTDGIGGTVNVNYAYDNTSSANSKGRLTQAAYSGGNTQFAYDELGRELQSIKAMNTTNYSVNRSYNALNNLLQIQYPDQKNIYYKYNGAGQIEAISNDATILPQSFNLLDRTSYIVLRTSKANDVQSTNDEVRNLNDERRNASAFASNVLAWLERNLLGVGEAYAQAALPDSFKQESSSNGLVAIEAENYHANVTPVTIISHWDKVTTTGQSGVNSMKANPNSGVNNDTGYTTKSPRLDYKIKFVKTGTHYIWIRGIGATGSDDSLHAGLDGQALTTSDRIANFTASWTWSKTTADASAAATINVATAGDHTLNLWMREDGMVIDKIVVTTSSTYTPSGTGPAESPQFPPVAPVLNAPVTGNAQVSLSWNAVSGASGYKVYRRLVSTAYATATDVGLVTNRTVTGLTNGTLYYFVVAAYNAAGQSVYSNEVSAAPVAPPSVPTAPVLNTATAGDKKVTLTWAASAGATGYKVKYGTTGGTYTTTLDVGNVTSYPVAGLTNGKTYYFVVVAYNSAGTGANSNEKSAVPTIQPFATTLEAEAMPTKTTGGTTTGGWNIWSNGYVEDTITFPRSGTYEFEVVARGSVAAGVWPNMQLRLDQVSKADITVNTTAWKSFIKQVSVASGSRRVAVAFTNDYKTTTEDRNLYVDKVIIREIVSSPPSVPTLNSPAASDTKVDLSWSAVTGVTGYKIYYGTAAGQYGTPISVGNTTTATVTGLTNGTKYYFAVSAVNAGGESGKSNEVNATPTAPITESPTLFIKNVDYNATGQMTRVEYGNGNVTTYTYDPLTLRLTRLTTYDLRLTTIQDLSYTYDSAGNILSIDDKVNTADQTFKYDELNRLTEAAGQGYGTKTYVYDTIGNIVQKDGKTYFYGDGVAAGPHAVTSLSDGTTFTYDPNGNLTQQTQSTQSTQYTYDAENRLVKVTKNGSTVGQYEYDGDGGRTKKTATVSGATTTTTFVGSLFETSGSRNTKFIFLGGQRVAAVTNSPSVGSTTLYYHADHLGGANVLTDATGFKKELIEYEPFGLESRHEKYGSNEEVAWYYFTGKPKDDETGLYYFGARYYDPKLGRFITADTIVPYPTNPQAFNRYSYAGNNPVSHLEDGHGWWKKSWKNFVHALRHPFDIEGQWKNLVGEAKDPDNGPIVSGLTAFVFSGFNPVVGISAALTSYSLSTPPGQKLTNWVANEIYDDILGFSPRTAYMLAYIDLIMTGTYLSERAFANILADPVQINGNLTDAQIEELRKNGQFVGDENVFGPSLKTKGAFEKNNVKGLMQDGKLVGSFQKRTLDVPGLRQLGAQHSSANVLTVSASASKLNPWRYATWGVCHQATNATLLNGGISSTILNLGPSWDMFVTTAVYGNYGGQLGARTLLGINANRDYYERQK